MTIVTLLQYHLSHQPFSRGDFLEERVMVYHVAVQNFHDVLSQTLSVWHYQFVTGYPPQSFRFLFHSPLVYYGIV